MPGRLPYVLHLLAPSPIPVWYTQLILALAPFSFLFLLTRPLSARYQVILASPFTLGIAIRANQNGDLRRVVGTGGGGEDVPRTEDWYTWCFQEGRRCSPDPLSWPEDFEKRSRMIVFSRWHGERCYILTAVKSTRTVTQCCLLVPAWWRNTAASLCYIPHLRKVASNPCYVPLTESPASPRVYSR